MAGMTLPTGNAPAEDPMMSGSPTDEAGANDNLLQLNPSDPNFTDIVGDWQDGEEYTITLRVTQVSPGMYTPTKAVSGEPAGDEQAQAAAPGSDEGEGDEQPMSSNPAVDKLLRGGGDEA